MIMGSLISFRGRVEFVEQLAGLCESRVDLGHRVVEIPRATDAIDQGSRELRHEGFRKELRVR